MDGKGRIEVVKTRKCRLESRPARTEAGNLRQLLEVKDDNTTCTLGPDRGFGAVAPGLAASLGLGNDEAYHYLFAVHRDWSYFDHPPMLAVVERLGIGSGGGRATRR